MVSYFKYLDDLAKKEKDAQKWAYEKFPKYFGPNNTPKERATFAQFGDEITYHGTDADFTGFKVDPSVNYSHAHISSTPDPKIADHFAKLAGKYPEGAKVYPVRTRGNHFSLKDKEAVREVTDMIETQIGFEHSDEAVESVLRDLRGGNAYWKTMEHPMVRKALKYTGYDSFDTAEGVSKVINKANFNPSDVRSPFATFDLRKLGLGGAGSYLSADLMADELDLEHKPKPSMFKGLMETIGNVNQQQAQAYGNTGVGVASGVGSLLADPAIAAELAVRGMAGLGLGGLLMSNELNAGEDQQLFLQRLKQR